MKYRRPVAQINLDLETAIAYRDRYATRPTSDPLVAEMRAANDAEIEDLQHELREALADPSEGGWTSP
ncbi:MAG: hypothetical protein ACYCST_16985 [Acidimicrobiales bacterium]